MWEVNPDQQPNHLRGPQSTPSPWHAMSSAPRLIQLLTGADADGKRYKSIDPAPPADANMSVDEHVKNLLDPSIRLFERYGNLFALRDKGNDEAVMGLSRVLLEDKSSAVLRHEVAFVLGQCANKLALPSLITSLEDLDENQVCTPAFAELVELAGMEAVACFRPHRLPL